MPGVYVSVGSNLQRDENIHGGIRRLRQRFGRIIVSTVYQSPAIGFEGGDFYNLVVGLDTDLQPQELNAELRRIEAAQGRRRDEENVSSRTLDLDLLLYGDLVIDDGDLRIPRDDIERYAFVLAPLAEIAPQARHPVSGKTFSELWRQFDESSQPLEAVTEFFEDQEKLDR